MRKPDRFESFLLGCVVGMFAYVIIYQFVSGAWKL